MSDRLLLLLVFLGGVACVVVGVARGDRLAIGYGVLCLIFGTVLLIARAVRRRRYARR
ncbi:hypothetical protein ACIHEI_36600 [Kitasatospora sp. NPDC051984]|uniref:hypothetical protein n=1 Tax=Kitasatospora sp. NPDC051984 TaxID=3364059 RepID=UPI0037C95969